MRVNPRWQTLQEKCLLGVDFMVKGAGIESGDSGVRTGKMTRPSQVGRLLSRNPHRPNQWMASASDITSENPQYLGH